MEDFLNIYRDFLPTSEKPSFTKGDLVEALWKGSWMEGRVISIQGEKVRVRLFHPVLFEKKSLFQERNFFGEEKILRKKFSNEFRIFELSLDVSSIRITKPQSQNKNFR
jgi:hypothetical protein